MVLEIHDLKTSHPRDGCKETCQACRAKKALPKKLKSKCFPTTGPLGGGAPVAYEVTQILVEALSNLWWAKASLGLKSVQHVEGRKNFKLVCGIGTFVVSVKKEPKQ